MSGNTSKLERLKMLFPGHRRMRRLEQRLELLQAELLAAVRREMASVSDSVNVVRAEGHAERDSAFLRQIEAIKGQAEGLLKALRQDNASLADQLKLVRAEGHAERDSAFERQVAVVRECAAGLTKSVEQGNASLTEQIEHVRVEGHAERDSAFERQEVVVRECAAGLAKSMEQGNASLAEQIERVRVEGHVERDSAFEREINAMKARAADLAETISQGNASLAEQIERVRVEGHAERDSAFERQVAAVRECAAGLTKSMEQGNASLAGQIERVRVEGHDERLAASEQLKSHAAEEYRRVVTELFRNDIRCRWQIVDALDALLFPPTSVATCPICGHVEPRTAYETKVSECRFGGGRLERYVCPDCGAIFGPLKMMRLSAEQLGEEYKQSYAVYSESDCTLLEKLAFEALRPRKTGIYLNYGAGAWNRTTKDLRDAGYEVYDYEPYAPAETNDWVIRSFSDLEKMRFDGIFSNDLIEHLQNPVVDLKAMAKLLKNGGKMAHCSGCYEYAFEYTRFHLFFLTGNSLKRLSAAAGLGFKLGNRLFDYSPARICLFQKRKSAETV